MRKPVARVELRASLALLVATAAASRHAWYDGCADRIRVDCLAPRGACDETPTRVVWRASRPIEELQVEWRDAAGTRCWWRRLAADGAGGSFALTKGERSAIEAARGGSWTALALGRDGEWQAEAAPAEVTLPGGVTAR
jgi:hypothetical protein